MIETFMEDLDERAYKEFRIREAECHSHNLQMALDLMKDATPKELTQLQKFTKNSCKEYNDGHWGQVLSKPIAWKREWK